MADRRVPGEYLAPGERLVPDEPLAPGEPLAPVDPLLPVAPVVPAEPPPSDLAGAARAAGGAALWVVASIVIALGAAGLVAAMQPGPDRPVIPGLTYPDDASVTRRLEAGERDLAALAADVDALGLQARGALAAMVSAQPDTVDGAIGTGNELLVGIGERARAMRADLATVPFVRAPDADLHVSLGVRERYERLAAALTATDGLAAAWDQLTVGAAAAGRLAAQLAEHDRLVGVAAEQGRAAKYKTAIKTLGTAADTIKASRAVRDLLARTVDVTVLDQWLDRNETYDTALAGLYQALSSVGGKVTDKVREAIAAEKAARQGLPPDARAMVVIMADIGQGALNRAVIVIEQAKADLADALEPEALPSATP